MIKLDDETNPLEQSHKVEADYLNQGSLVVKQWSPKPYSKVRFLALMHMKKKLTKAILTMYHWDAIRMRYDGHTYANITDHINQTYEKSYSLHTIKWWFYKTGALAKLFEEYADQQDELETKIYKHYLKGNVAKACKVLVNLLSSKDERVRLSASQEIINRIEGKNNVKENIEDKNEPKQIEGNKIVFENFEHEAESKQIL